jgi:hypothetical protein
MMHSAIRFAPCDLLPDFGGLRDPVLMFDFSPHPANPAGLAALGRKWRISGAAAICVEVETAAVLWRHREEVHGA